MLEDDELRAIRTGIPRWRRYAAMREGGAKEEKEMGVVTDLLESMECRGERHYVHPRLVQDDPPDCTVETPEGERVAMEVTEFVSQAAIEHNQRLDPRAIACLEPRTFVYADWSEADALEHIQHLLLKKDAKELRGGPYARYVAVIHTDEPLLLRCQAEEWLAGHTFGPFRQLDEAYFLYSYEPEEGYVYSHLELDTVMG